MYKSGGNTASKQYQQMSVRHEVETASPHRLIQLMMERAVTKIGIARGYMERNAVAEKGIHIGDAISIINGLQASLNHKPNSRLSGNFDALYDYMARRLLEANLNNQPDILNEVAGLMREMKEAWDAIGPEVAKAAANAAPN
ncbi:MAG: flagellar export chaperone FliS [Gammaproteobacteria bacterium]|nr:flagellar export chaperone FliS [Gammaproteobacteria bacterium]MDH4313252.1 flagellar export chaperone FliS [Gammaproteobacteria bacterium]MDH5213542.1 flagellar export chaperone FliS [Gammaproteobacteria bacterium]